MVQSLGFVGVRTNAFAEMAALDRDVLGLEPVHERPGAAWFKAGGNVYEIIGPDRSAA